MMASAGKLDLLREEKKPVRSRGWGLRSSLSPFKTCHRTCTQKASGTEPIRITGNSTAGNIILYLPSPSHPLLRCVGVDLDRAGGHKLGQLCQAVSGAVRVHKIGDAVVHRTGKPAGAGSTVWKTGREIAWP